MKKYFGTDIINGDALVKPNFSRWESERMKTLREWLKDTYEVRYGYQVTRPRIVCKDGFSMSVQA